ncbi:MAG: MarR family transcriptional regulator [Firmicutes bacterium]|nr:MarR family transcriptional regulator [Bacillota bacterium]
MIERFEKFSLAISEINRYWHKIASDEMEQYGLKGPYAVYLVVMHRYPQGITAARLCEICDRNKADVSRAISDMEKKGLVYREGASYRAKLLLTEEGSRAASHVAERATKAVEEGGKGLSEERRIVFYETLDLVASNLREITKEGLPQQHQKE